MPRSLLREQEQKGCEALLLTINRGPAAIQPLQALLILSYNMDIFMVLLLCFHCAYIANITVPGRLSPGKERTELETPVRIMLFLNNKRTHANDLFDLKRFSQQLLVLRSHYI